jgi:hypothetical protein
VTPNLIKNFEAMLGYGIIIQVNREKREKKEQQEGETRSVA